MTRRKKIWVFGLGGFLGLLLLTVLTAVVVVQTDWFKNKVRARIVSETENATGGRVEIGHFDYDWHNLTAEVAPFVIHGTEPPQARPFFRADKIRVGLKIISLMEKQVDLLALTVEKPQLSITVKPDGSSNVPVPRVSKGPKKNFVQQLLDLKVRHFELNNGFADYNSQRIPLDLQGDHLQASVNYEAAGPRYIGKISSRQIRVASPALKTPLGFDFDTEVALERNRIRVLSASLTGEGSKIAMDGVVQDLSSPHANFNLTATAPVKELDRAFGLPLESIGVASFQGKGSIESAPFGYKLEGKLVARELAIAPNNSPIRGIGLVSRVEVTPGKIRLPDLQLVGMNGRFKGSAEILDFKKFSVRAAASGVSLQEVTRLWKLETGELSGTLDGNIRVDGQFAAKGAAGILVDAKLDIVPAAGGVPVEGAVSVNYDQRAGRVQLGDSHLNIGSSGLAVSGTLGETLTVHATSRQLPRCFAAVPAVRREPSSGTSGVAPRRPGGIRWRGNGAAREPANLGQGGCHPSGFRPARVRSHRQHARYRQVRRQPADAGGGSGKNAY